MTPTPGSDVVAPHRPSILRFLLLALLAPAALAATSWWLGNEYALTETMRGEARDAYDRRSEASTLIARIADAESSQRGYILTGDPAFLDLYEPARSDVAGTFRRLAAELRDEPDTAALLARLRTLAEQKFAEMDGVIADRDRGGIDEAVRHVRLGRGKHLMDAMRTTSAQMVSIAASRRDAHVNAYVQRIANDHTKLWIGVAAIAAIFLGGAAIVWLQTNARYRARMAAQVAADRNRSILDSTIDAIAILNPSGTIESINAAASALLGYRSDELERRDVSVLIRLSDQPATFHERIGLRDGRLAQSWLPDRTVLHKDGREIPVDIALGVMPQPDGYHIVASVRDISERKRIERIKDDLMSTVSHELRTPLTSIVGALGLLRAGSAGDLPGAAQRLVEIAENNSRRLIRLINDMLDIDRLQSGRLQIDRQPIDLRAVVMQACEGSQGQADAADVRIVCRFPPDPVRVAGDADRLLQVVSNLASNAIRVSPSGDAIEIGLAVDRADARAQVTVDDHGPGVPMEFRDRIFGRFERAAGESSAGTGLGLAISREIIARHDGRIWFEDLSRGTRFGFQIDLLRDGANSSPVEGGHSDGAIPAQPVVLHLDDDHDMLDIVASALAPDVRTCKASDLATAGGLIATERFDAAILDVDLAGGASGLDLLPSLVAADGRRIPTILFSAHDVDAAAAAQVDAVLVKSRGSLPDLKATVRRVLARGRRVS